MIMLRWVPYFSASKMMCEWFFAGLFSYVYVNLKFYWAIYSLRFLRRKKMSNIEKAGSSHQIPYIKEIERLALKILRENPDDKEKLKEILEDYASRYAREYNIRV